MVPTHVHAGWYNRTTQVEWECMLFLPSWISFLLLFEDVGDTFSMLPCNFCAVCAAKQTEKNFQPVALVNDPLTGAFAGTRLMSGSM